MLAYQNKYIQNSIKSHLKYKSFGRLVLYLIRRTDLLTYTNRQTVFLQTACLIVMITVYCCLEDGVFASAFAGAFTIFSIAVCDNILNIKLDNFHFYFCILLFQLSHLDSLSVIIIHIIYTRAYSFTIDCLLITVFIGVFKIGTYCPAFFVIACRHCPSVLI